MDNLGVKSMSKKARIDIVKQLQLIHKIENEYGTLALAPIDDLIKLQRVSRCSRKEIERFKELCKTSTWVSRTSIKAKEKYEREHPYKPGDTVTDGWATYAFDYDMNLRLVSYGNHAKYKVSKKKLKALRGEILGNLDIVE